MEPRAEHGRAEGLRADHRRARARAGRAAREAHRRRGRRRRVDQFLHVRCRFFADASPNVLMLPGQVRFYGIHGVGVLLQLGRHRLSQVFVSLGSGRATTCSAKAQTNGPTGQS